MALGLSGSTIKSWFQYRCERKTRYEIMDPSELAAIPVAKDDREQPWANLGVDYEDRVVSRLARETIVLRPGLSDEGLLERHAVAFLKGQGSARFAAQVNLRPRSSALLCRRQRRYPIAAKFRGFGPTRSYGRWATVPRNRHKGDTLCPRLSQELKSRSTQCSCALSSPNSVSPAQSIRREKYGGLLMMAMPRATPAISRSLP